MPQIRRCTSSNTMKAAKVISSRCTGSRSCTRRSRPISSAAPSTVPTSRAAATKQSNKVNVEGSKRIAQSANEAAVYPPKAYRAPCATLTMPITPKISVSPRETRNSRPAYEMPSARASTSRSRVMVMPLMSAADRSQGVSVISCCLLIVIESTSYGHRSSEQTQSLISEPGLRDFRRISGFSVGACRTSS